MPKSVSLRFGKSWMPVNVPESAVILHGSGTHAAPDALQAVRSALAKPIACASLAQLLRQRPTLPQTVAITISDITRPVPNEPIVTALLEVLNAAGIPDRAVVVVIATGMHRPSTPEERLIMLGPSLLQRLEVIDHVADDAPSMVQVSQEPPVSINARFAHADFKIVTGLIEPHFMAGYSGGRKGVCPGLVDLKTLQRFHGYKIMADRRSVEGLLESNPCHDEALRVARLVGVDFLVNVTITHDRKLAAVYAGDMEAAHLQGCKSVEQATKATIERPFDLVVTSAGGYPLDANLYQTYKGVVMALPALHAQSTLLIVSACETVGSPEFTELMLRYSNNWQQFLADIATQDAPGKDQWQLQMATRVLDRIGVDRLLLANDGLDLALQRRMCVTPLPGAGPAPQRVQQFIDQFASRNPKASIAVIPEGPYTMLQMAQSIS